MSSLDCSFTLTLIQAVVAIIPFRKAFARQLTVIERDVIVTDKQSIVSLNNYTLIKVKPKLYKTHSVKPTLNLQQL